MMKMLTENQITDLVSILIGDHGCFLSGSELTDRILELLEDISGFEFIDDQIFHIIISIQDQYHANTTTENH